MKKGDRVIYTTQAGAEKPYTIQGVNEDGTLNLGGVLKKVAADKLRLAPSDAPAVAEEPAPSPSVRVFQAMRDLLAEHGAADPEQEARMLLVRISEAVRFGNFATGPVIQAMLRLPLEVEQALRAEE